MVIGQQISCRFQNFNKKASKNFKSYILVVGRDWVNEASLENSWWPVLSVFHHYSLFRVYLDKLFGVFDIFMRLFKCFWPSLSSSWAGNVSQHYPIFSIRNKHPKIRNMPPWRHMTRKGGQIPFIFRDPPELCP